MLALTLIFYFLVFALQWLRAVGACMQAPPNSYEKPQPPKAFAQDGMGSCVNPPPKARRRLPAPVAQKTIPLPLSSGADSDFVKQKTIHAFIWNIFKKISKLGNVEREDIARHAVGDFKKYSLTPTGRQDPQWRGQ